MNYQSLNPFEEAAETCSFTEGGYTYSPAPPVGCYLAGSSGDGGTGPGE